MTTPKQPIPSRVHADDFTADARTVLPGQPVGYHGSVSWRTPLGICIGTPVEVQTDPSKIVGVCNPSAPEPDYPPIPEPGFYWAKLWDSRDEWTVVKVRACWHREGHQVDCIGWEGGSTVAEWGPRLEPPR